MTEDSRLNKIVKLLAQAESTTHPEEAKTFSAKAQALMTEWQIDEAQLAEAAAKNGAVSEVPADEKIFLPGTQYQASTLQIWCHALKANGVRLVTLSGEKYFEDWKERNYSYPTRKGVWLHMFGFEHNITMGKMLAASLMLQMENEYQAPDVQLMRRLEAGPGTGSIKWKNGFIFGYARAIGVKLEAAKRAVVGTELVLVRRDEIVDTRVKEVYAKLGKKSTSAGRGRNSSHSLGHAAGNRANLGNSPTVSNTNRKAL
jgi:hypothetical protein